MSYCHYHTFWSHSCNHAQMHSRPKCALVLPGALCWHQRCCSAVVYGLLIWQAPFCILLFLVDFLGVQFLDQSIFIYLYLRVHCQKKGNSFHCLTDDAQFYLPLKQKHANSRSNFTCIKDFKAWPQAVLNCKWSPNFGPSGTPHMAPYYLKI